MGKKLIWILPLMMLLTVAMVAADLNIKAGQQYTLTSITQCVGDVEVNFRGEKPIEPGEYAVIGCVEHGANAWMCPCSPSGPTDIKFQTKETTANTYDSAMEYYIAAKLPETSNDANTTVPSQNAITNDNNRRTVSVGNIAVSSSTTAAPTKDVPQVNTADTPKAMMVLGIVALVIILGMLLIGKWLYNSRENKLDEEKKIERGDMLEFHNRTTKNGAPAPTRMNFFDSSSNSHTQEQVPIYQQSKTIPPEFIPPPPPMSVFRGPEYKPKPKEITSEDVDDFLNRI
jgi:hypothetical protein